MSFNPTVDQLSQILKGNKEIEAWHKAMTKVLPKYKIDTAERIAMFLAQCGHESLNFTVLEENLNYSAQALQKTWPKRFDAKLAAQMQRQPQKIAEIAYGGRMGNVEPGDGYRFRGQGIIQLTGRENYTAFGKTLNKTALEVVEYVKTKEGALESACWFWNTRNLNKASDAKDVTAATKLINGGTIGLADRQKHFTHALEVLSGHVAAPKPVTAPVAPVAPVSTPAMPVLRTIKLGAKGPLVKKLQESLGLVADSSFGPATETKLKEWQAANGFEADGIATKDVLFKLFS